MTQNEPTGTAPKEAKPTLITYEEMQAHAATVQKVALDNGRREADREWRDKIEAVACDFDTKAMPDVAASIRALIGGDVGAILYAREWLEEHDHEEREPGPYAKAFRERVCPVPEFPSIRETAHEAIIEGGCCIQCGLPNNSETVLFHSCQAGAPADPTCPNTGHKFSHCDCDLGIEKEES